MKLMLKSYFYLFTPNMRPTSIDITNILSLLKDPTQKDVLQLEHTLSFIHKCFKHQEFDLLDHLLFECTTIQMPSLVSVSLLRNTQNYKKSLKSWRPCAAHINRCLKLKNMGLENFDIICH